MAKYKNIHKLDLRFSLNGKEYFIEKSETLELPENELYVDSLVQQGYLELVAEPKSFTKNKDK